MNEDFLILLDIRVQKRGWRRGRTTPLWMCAVGNTYATLRTQVVGNSVWARLEMVRDAQLVKGANDDMQ